MLGFGKLVVIWAFVLCLLCCSASSSSSPPRYLIVSAPRESKVAYMKIRRGADPGSERMTALISSGLVHPQGLAIDQKRNHLLVADPDSRKIFSYELRDAGESLSIGPQGVAVENAESRWVAVDGAGNIFLTDEPQNRVLRVEAAKAARGEATPDLVYDGTVLTQVSAPGGIAVDSFYTYWVNKQIGSQVGSVVKGSVAPGQTNVASSVNALATNTDKSYGVCTALSNVYYTQPEKTICAVKKTGSDVQIVSNRFVNPRGCAWDGDGTVYVADRGANAVYSFAGNMQNLGTALITKAVDFQDAFGVAVFVGSAYRSTGPCLGCALLVAIAVTAVAF